MSTAEAALVIAVAEASNKAKVTENERRAVVSESFVIPAEVRGEEYKKAKKVR
jgi:hypothetical protein